MTKGRSSGRKVPVPGGREYSRVIDFLSALTDAPQEPAHVLLSPVFRRLSPGSGCIRVQAGVMLNGQRPGASPVHSCIALAAEASIVGTSGRLTYPVPDFRDDARVQQRVQAMQQELLATLAAYLRTDPRVQRLTEGALWTPTTRFWHHNALFGLPIAYLDGHWVATA